MIKFRNALSPILCDLFLLVIDQGTLRRQVRIAVARKRVMADI